MSNEMISLLVAISVSAWVYAKMLRSSGGNKTNAIVAGAGAGLVALLAMLAILGFIF